MFEQIYKMGEEFVGLVITTKKTKESKTTNKRTRSLLTPRKTNYHAEKNKVFVLNIMA